MRAIWPSVQFVHTFCLIGAQSSLRATFLSKRLVCAQLSKLSKLFESPTGKLYYALVGACEPATEFVGPTSKPWKKQRVQKKAKQTTSDSIQDVMFVEKTLEVAKSNNIYIMMHHHDD